MLGFKKSSIDFLIVGLGNPGSRYENTRHNAGFMAIDLLSKQENFDVKKSKFHSLYADVNIKGKRCLVVKPQTMMNNSGEAVYEIASFYKIPDENIIIIYDDISLDVGKIRIRRKGSAGGHNGIKSIISCLGSETFPRVKIGVDKKPHPEYDLASWVLAPFPKEKIDDLNKALDDAVNSVYEIISNSVDSAMNKYNS